MTRCPSSAELGQWLADGLARADAAAVEAHVETCVTCQQALERLTDDVAVRRDQGPVSHGESGGAFLLRLEREPPTDTWLAPGQNERGKGKRGLVPPDPDGPAGLTVAVAAARSSQSAAEIQALLRKRLLFLAALSWAAFAVYAAFCVVLYPEPFALAFYALLLAETGLFTVLLRSSRPLSLRQLRWVEAALFASVALFNSWLQWLFFSTGWVTRMAGEDWVSLMLAARGLSLAWVILVVSYGLLIPNTWRRCAAVLGVMAPWPVLLNATLVLGEERGGEHLIFVAETGFVMSIGAALGLYGAHRLETLRQQAARARTLGQYRLKQFLGAGGMGEVYLAEHALLRRPCAVKLIRPERAGDPRNLARFEREVQATVALSHPNIVEVFDYGHTEDGTFYYVMEYLPGLNLDELVRRHGPLPPGRVIHLLRQVCGALQEAHAGGLIHRDIKPSNILVCQRGGRHDVAKLLDFGLVQTHGLNQDGTQLTQEGAIPGTPAYMSPEQGAGLDLDARSDLYSLGAVAYFLLTGRPPFARGSAVQTLAAHLAEPVVAPDRHRPEVPADLQAVVLRCLEKDPSRRFPDAGTLDQALARCGCADQWTREKAAAWWREYAAGDPQEASAGVGPHSLRSPV
jgi:eukaryotic-like serine/threonine-protein kinase